jgi:hypothetical protein
MGMAHGRLSVCVRALAMCECVDMYSRPWLQSHIGRAVGDGEEKIADGALKQWISASRVDSQDGPGLDLYMATE